MKTGDHCFMTFAGRTVPAIIALASPNEKSLMVSFDSMLGPYLISVPLLMGEDGIYRDLICNESATITIAPVEAVEEERPE